MDIQRTILLMIFVMSGFFLFEAWQKENRPPAPPPGGYGMMTRTGFAG